MDPVTETESRAGLLDRRRVAVGWLLAVPGSVALAAGLVPLRSGTTPSYEAVLFLALAVACALVGGLWPALAASMLGTVLLNYYFTAPLHSLTIAGPGNVVTLLAYVVVSVAVASVVNSAARRRDQATRARAEAATLAMLNRRVLGGEYDGAGLLGLVRETFDAAAVELVDEAGRATPGDSLVAAGRGRFLLVRGRVLDGADLRILEAFSSHLGVLHEREELARQRAAARELEEGNRTRTALLAAVSHDLRTPLAGIRAAAETLRVGGERLPPGDKDELLAEIERSTARLTTIVADLLDMSRLQTGAVRPILAPVDLGAVVARAARAVPGRERIQVSEDLPDAVADGVLLERVVENLLSNAARHADHVRVSAERADREVLLRVADDGPGVPAEHRAQMFEPFQRLGDTPGGEGVGLGLAVARGLAEAQGGSLRASETVGGGLTMTVVLRADT